MTRPDPVFEAPWHAELFALTVHLNEAGHFTWPEWAARFGASLASHGVDRSLDGGDDYFTAWLATLESLLDDLRLASPTGIAELKRAWTDAYLTTPHGMPVHLRD